MEYAIQLLLPILGGLWLGDWLTKTYHLPALWTMVFAVLGMVAGLGILYKRATLTPRPPLPPSLKRAGKRTGSPPADLHADETTALSSISLASSHLLKKTPPEKKLEWHELDFLYRLNDEPTGSASGSMGQDDLPGYDFDNDEDDNAPTPPSQPKP
jgi:Putative F0F1-ATPase subunit Ca2+/Mg2+ transporter